MDPLVRLRAWLGDHPADGAELRLDRPDVKALVEEVLRLRQGNERLRKQNRKLRRRSGRLPGDDGGVTADPPDDGDELARTGAPTP